jgi:hypothetical protein
MRCVMFETVVALQLEILSVIRVKKRKKDYTFLFKFYIRKIEAYILCFCNKTADFAALGLLGRNRLGSVHTWWLS